MKETAMRKLPDKLAEREIRLFLRKKKESRQMYISIIELMQELILPPEQIERIMSRLKGSIEV